MKERLAGLVERARTSDLFVSPRIEADLVTFLGEQGGRVRTLAQRVAGGEFSEVRFVGSGGSWANMYSGHYLMDRLTDVPSVVVPSYELTWRRPTALNRRSLVFLASYSGATEDTLAALRYANSLGAHTVAITRRLPSPMASEASEVLDYDSTALYDLPLASVTMFALELAQIVKCPRQNEAQAARAELDRLPQILGHVYRQAEAPAYEHAKEYLSSDLLYVLASGPLYGLGYKFALTVFMENVRIHGSVIESAEFRHGPVEMLERKRPDMIALLGTDESRDMTSRVVTTVRSNGGRVLVLDAKDYPSTHPLLEPFVLQVPLMWFTVFSALLRGIDDLDERVFMGQRSLSVGPDATWP